MINLMNVKENDKKIEAVAAAIEAVLSCDDGKYVEEVYAKDGSFVNGLFSNWVSLMIELNPEFKNKSLYNVIDNVEESCTDFTLIISTEPNTAERGCGTVLWRREE